MINLFGYKFNGKTGSTREVIEDEAMVELELLVNNLSNVVMKEELSLSDLFVCITGSDVFLYKYTK